jgi:hypothetical protein
MKGTPTIASDCRSQFARAARSFAPGAFSSTWRTKRGRGAS